MMISVTTPTAPAWIVETLARDEAQLGSIEGIIGWSPLAGKTLVEFVQQDEYSHDIVLAFGKEHFLAFEVT